jgi:hypothetical protein
MDSTVSVFSQVLGLVPKDDFRRAASELKAEANAKGFTSWAHFTSMLFCQLAQAKSLREISMGLASCEGKLNHLGIAGAPCKSTLSYANNHRPAELFERTFQAMLAVCRQAAPGKKAKFRFRNKLFSLDATTIELCLNLFPWAKFRQTKGAIKLHTLLDHDGYLPIFVRMTEGRTHEINVARVISLPKGSIVAMDRAYDDYSLFHRWTQDGVFFVTRAKSNMAYEVVAEHEVPAGAKGAVRDRTIRLTGPKSREECPELLRLVTVRDEDGNEFELLTNHLLFAASTIGAIYKDRWEIETFFKTIKQNLKIKTFVGTSPNALLTQIWTALTAILLLKFLRFKSKLAWAFSNLVALIRWNLFTHRNLWAWLDDPSAKPPPPDQPAWEQPLLDSILAV